MNLYCNNMDYVIREVQMPPGIHGAIMYDDENRANIYINSNDTPERQLQAIWHELRHMVNEDMTNGRPIREIEGLPA